MLKSENEESLYFKIGSRKILKSRPKPEDRLLSVYNKGFVKLGEFTQSSILKCEKNTNKFLILNGKNDASYIVFDEKYPTDGWTHITENVLFELKKLHSNKHVKEITTIESYPTDKKQNFCKTARPWQKRPNLSHVSTITNNCNLQFSIEIFFM